MSEPYELPLFPLNTVLFPGMVLPLHIFEARYIDMIRECLANDQPFGVILLKSGRAEGELGPIYGIGTAAHVTQTMHLPDDRMNIVTVGQQRFRILEVHHQNEYLTGIVEDYPLENADTPESQVWASKISQVLSAYLKKFKELGKIEADFRQLPGDAATLAFLTAIFLPIADEAKQELLSVSDAHTMLEQEYALLKHEALILDILANERKIQPDSSLAFSLN